MPLVYLIGLWFGLGRYSIVDAHGVGHDASDPGLLARFYPDPPRGGTELHFLS